MIIKLSEFTDSELIGSIFPDDAIASINNLKEILTTLFRDHSYYELSNKIHKTAVIQGPVYIGKGAIIGPCAYIRGPAYIGENCVVGHCTEVKNSILLPGAKAAHSNYVGDSILGMNVNLGAGTRIANLRLDREEIIVDLFCKIEGGMNGYIKIDTGRKKFGSILSDGVQTSCNVVLDPGSLFQTKGRHVKD